MIVHSTTNVDSEHCLVQVEGIDRGYHEVTVRLFAQGAAGKHNPGYRTTASAVEWCDKTGRPLAEGSDTSQATVARVLCRVEVPS